MFPNVQIVLQNRHVCFQAVLEGEFCLFLKYIFLHLCINFESFESALYIKSGSMPLDI